jgi:hypothetical protein
MEALISDCENTFNELSQFSANILSLANSIVDDRLEVFEKEIGYSLPFDFKFFLERSNGFSLLGVEVFGLGSELKGSSLDAIYDFEHRQVYKKMPLHFLPFSDDGRGNHYCLDLHRLTNQTCSVVFWQHDYDYTSLEEIETCNDSFVSWLKEVMIEWALERYNYDGSEKHAV